MIDPLTYAVTLPTLYAAHTLADHVVQTDHQAASKAGQNLAEWAPAMAGHVGGYQATQALALAAVLPAARLRPTWRGLLAGSVLSAISHAFLDRRWPVIGLLHATGSPRFANPTIEEAVTPVETSPTYYGRYVKVPPRRLPLHGPYLADQALHTAFLALAAALIAWRHDA